MKKQFDTDRWDKEYECGAHWEKEYSQSAVMFAKLCPSGCRILDAGCGSGRNSLLFANMGLNVSGIDLSSVAIKKAKVKNKMINFLVGKLEALPFQDKYFEALYCAYVLSFTKYEKSITEFSRVLNGSGLAYIACLYETRYPENSLYDNYVDLQNILNKLNDYFIIKTRESDQYTEVDQHGVHTHKRIVLTLKKKQR